MKRLRFYVDITVETDSQDDYARCAALLENMIQNNGGFDLVRKAFYLDNAKVLRKKPRRPPQ